MKTQTTVEPTSDNWLPGFLHSAGLPENAPLEVLQKRMDQLADAAAPMARTWWMWMFLIQYLSVAAPLLWLTRRPLGLTPAMPALATAAAVIIFVASLWWMRWRGMQRAWARARLVAEVARSQIAASVCPVPLAHGALDAIPAIHSLLQSQHSSREKAWPDWKQDWITERLEKQLDYYSKAKVKAERARRQFTRWSTLFMDVMLAFSAAGVIVTLSHRAPRWLRMLGDYRIECVLGLAGVLLPLGIILLQSLRYLQELNRRSGRFSRQITMLEKARQSLLAAATPEKALQIVEATEEQLLSEVVDWYFEAETSEQFFQVREHRRQAKKCSIVPAARFPWLRPILWVWTIGVVGLLFFGRVVLGRVPWVVGASALTLGWLSYTSPTDPEARSRLRSEGSLVDGAGHPWQPSPELTPNGCIIIAHGLHDGTILTARGGESRWMREMSRALEHKLGGRPPNIGLVDWAAAASPSNIHSIDPKITAAKFVADVAGIRPEAREVGDYLAFRLAQLILEKKIDPTRPFHLIGHSAGGFVVARAALVLRKMNLAPATIHVTILDTPAPDAELLAELPKSCGVDFFVTSGFVLGLDDNAPPAGIYLKHIPSQKKLSLLDAHSYAHEWFTETILSAKPDADGFWKSPFVSPESKP